MTKTDLAALMSEYMGPAKTLICVALINLLPAGRVASNSGGWVYIPHKSLYEELNLEPKEYFKLLHELIEDVWILSCRNGTENKREFTFNFAKLEELVASTGGIDDDGNLVGLKEIRDGKSQGTSELVS